MSGHSKWHSIKHKKALVDAKRGKLFTRVIKEVQVAARMGGSDPDANPRLRTAIQAAKDVNMPKDTMERAIKKGAGELGANAMEEMTYEGYGPGGVAVMVQVTTDNRNRAAAEVRHAFTKTHGNLGQTGCVGYLFERKGLIEVEEGEEDTVMEAALEAGANDIENQGEGYFLVECDPDSVQDIREAMEAAGIKVSSSGAQLIPSTSAQLEGKEYIQCIKLIDMLEDNEDVTEVSHNLEMKEEEE
jgi:YebC/PmpR family DNA-binding regulatory protein